MKSFLLVVAATLCVTACSPEEPRAPAQTGPGSAEDFAEMVFTNGRIYTVNDAQPWAEAVAIRGNTFIAVGSSDEVAALVGDGTEVIDLDGTMMLPGLFDAHIHLENFYLAEKARDRLLGLPPVESVGEIRAAIQDYAEQRPELDVIFGANLPNELFPGGSPTKDFLDEILPNKPVFLITESGHEALLNSAALELVGIDDSTEDPENGSIVRDKTGEPTGFLKEAAMGRYAMPFLPLVSLEQHIDGMSKVIGYLNSLGMTSLKHIHATAVDAQALQALGNDGRLNMRVAIAWTYRSPLNPQPIEEQEEAIATRAQFASNLINPNYIKMNIDGIPTATAAMLEPYVGTDNIGLSFVDAEGLADTIARFDPEIDGLVFHTVGDRGARLVIDALELAKEELGSLNSRSQLAHGQFIAEMDLGRLKDVDLTVEFSPIMWFAGGLTNTIWDMVGSVRAEHYMPLRSVSDAGGRVVIASDGPIFFQTPLASLESAVTRLGPEGGEPSTSMDQAITLAEAIASRTINSAYLSNAEESVGSIEVGKLADFIVLDMDLFAIPIEDVSEAKVLLTVMDGRVVYEVSGN